MNTGDRDPGGYGRQRIVEAARVCFAESGLAGSTMKAVARRAEVTEGAVYYYFESKEALFEEVVRGPLERLVDGVGGTSDHSDTDTPQDAVDELHSRLLDTMSQVVPLFGVAVFSDVPQGKAWYSTVSSSLLNAGAVAAGRTIPDLRDDVPTDLLFRALVGMHMGLAIDTLLRGDTEKGERSPVDFGSLIRISGGDSAHSDDDRS